MFELVLLCLLTQILDMPCCKALQINNEILSASASPFMLRKYESCALDMCRLAGCFPLMLAHEQHLEEPGNFGPVIPPSQEESASLFQHGVHWQQVPGRIHAHLD